MSGSKHKSAKKGKGDSKSSTAAGAALKPTPAELIHFSHEIGLDLFGLQLRRKIAETKTKKDYTTLVKELASNRADSVEDRLRLALNFWTDVAAVAARVIDDERVPEKFSRDTRLEIRWRRKRKILVPKNVEDDAELRWEIAFDIGKPISETDALRLAGFRKENRMRAVLLEFGCPKELTKRLTEEAIKQLRVLNKKWLNALGADRSANHRRRNKEEEMLKTSVKLKNLPLPTVKPCTKERDVKTQVRDAKMQVRDGKTQVRDG
jgi:hypothetical protein